jgi:predicted amidohydrolase YtcJ
MTSFRYSLASLLAWSGWRRASWRHVLVIVTWSQHWSVAQMKGALLSIRPMPVLITMWFFVACSSTSVPQEPAPPADTVDVVTRSGSAAIVVVTNAEVHTVDPDRPKAEAFAYDETGVIIAVGTEADVLAAAGPSPTVIDAGANMVRPGFQDPHLHVPEAGINEGLCLLDPGLTLDDYGELLARCADDHRIGYKLHFHVIGDAATRMALDVIEAIDANPREVADRRHRLTHTYLVDPADVPRFAQLSVVAPTSRSGRSRAPLTTTSTYRNSSAGAPST